MSGFANLTLGMEEFTQGSSEATVSQLQAQVDADSAQLTQGATEIESAQVAVEEAIAQGEVLGQVQDSLQASVDAGEGVSPETAQVAEIAVEGICSLLRLPRTSRMAQENFGSVNGRVAATKLAIESIGDSIKALFERIKAIALRIWDKIKSFFLGLFKSVKGLSEHIETLKKRVADLDDTMKTKSDSLNNKTLARAFSVEKKANLSTFEKIVENSTAILSSKAELSKQLSGSVEDIKSLVTKEKVSDDEFNGAIAKLSSNIDTIMVNSLRHVSKSAATVKNEDKDSKVTYYGPFASCRVISHSASTSEVAGETFTSFSLSMTSIDTFEADKIDALKTKADMGKVLQLAGNLLDALDKTKRDEAALEKLNKDARAAGDNALASLGKMSDGQTSRERAFRKLAGQLQQINGVTAALGTSIPKAVYDAVKFGADYVSASIANMEKK